MRSRVLTVVAVGLLFALTACTDDAETPAGTVGPTPATGTASRGPDPIASAAQPTVVDRGTSVGTGRAEPAATATGFEDSTATFSDGLEVTVVQVTSGTVEGEGIGVFSGEPFSRIQVRVTNATQEPVDANTAIVEMRYGEPARMARPVYEPESRDLGGIIMPGDSLEATYAFSVPPQELSNVTLSLDIDGNHSLAVFHGELPS